MQIINKNSNQLRIGWSGDATTENLFDKFNKNYLQIYNKLKL